MIFLLFFCHEQLLACRFHTGNASATPDCMPRPGAGTSCVHCLYRESITGPCLRCRTGGRNYVPPSHPVVSVCACHVAHGRAGAPLPSAGAHASRGSTTSVVPLPVAASPPAPVPAWLVQGAQPALRPSQFNRQRIASVLTARPSSSSISDARRSISSICCVQYCSCLLSFP